MKATPCPARPSSWPRSKGAAPAAACRRWWQPRSSCARLPARILRRRRQPSRPRPPLARPPSTIRRSNPRGADAMAQSLKKVAMAGAVQPPAGSPTQHRVAVAGASGRMGHMLIEAIRASDDCRLAGALDMASSPAIGNDAAAFLGHASGVPVLADPRAALAHAQVLIDFTRPEAAMAYLRVCCE